MIMNKKMLSSLAKSSALPFKSNGFVGLIVQATQKFSKAESVSFKKSNKEVIDLKNKMYVPMQKLEFEKDSQKCLLYFYRPRFYTYPVLYSRFGAPFLGLAYLIKTNPFLLSFPAAIPLMFILETFLLKKLIDQKKTLRWVVSQIYLHKDGETLEVIYDNQLWRRLKKDEVSVFFHIPSLKRPEVDETIKPLQGELFPEDLAFEQERPVGWSWRKYYRNPRNYLTLPKNYNFANMEVLIAAFNGRIIDTSKRFVTEIDYQKIDKYLYV